MADVAAGMSTRRDSRGGIVASMGALAAAFLASLCCIGPLLFVTLGVGAGLASRFEPLRPAFTIVAVGLLALGFWSVYGRRSRDAEPCAPDGSCVAPRNRMRDQVILWSAALVATALLTFPEWSVILL